MKIKHIQQFTQLERYFFGAVHHCIYQTPSVAAFDSGIDVSIFNPIMINRSSADVLTEVQQAIKATGREFMFSLHQDCAVQLGEFLNQQGFSAQERTTAMALDMTEIKPVHSTLDIRCVNDDLTHWAMPLSSAFDAPLDIVAQYQFAHQRAIEKGATIYHFALFEEGIAVSALTLTLKDNAARLDDIGTHESVQRKGYASALIHHALAFALQQNINTCYLEASNAGLVLYKQLGFKPLFENVGFYQG